MYVKTLDGAYAEAVKDLSRCEDHIELLQGDLQRLQAERSQEREAFDHQLQLTKEKTRSMIEGDLNQGLEHISQQFQNDIDDQKKAHLDEKTALQAQQELVNAQHEENSRQSQSQLEDHSKQIDDLKLQLEWKTLELTELTDQSREAEQQHLLVIEELNQRHLAAIDEANSLHSSAIDRLMTEHCKSARALELKHSESTKEYIEQLESTSSTLRNAEFR